MWVLWNKLVVKKLIKVYAWLIKIEREKNDKLPISPNLYFTLIPAIN